jgi:hypothetical protein
MATHTCSKCGEVKAKTEFYKDSHSPLGHRSDCKICNKQRSLSYAKTNREKVTDAARKRRETDPEKYSAKWREYRQANKEACAARDKAKHKRKLQTDPLYRFKTTLRDLVKKSIRNGGWSKGTRSEEIIGCSFDDLQAHLISTALDNYGYWLENEAYHVDHIKPMASAKTNEEAIALNHWTNFQYLTPADNLRKGGVSFPQQ